MNPPGTSFGFPGPPRFEVGVRLRRLLAVEGELAWWEATLVADGSRRVALLRARTSAGGLTSTVAGGTTRDATVRAVGQSPADVEPLRGEIEGWPVGFLPFSEGIALSGVVQVLLEEWLPLPGETAFDTDELLVARLACVFAAAAGERERPGFKLPSGEAVAVAAENDASERVPEFASEADLALAARIFLADGRWWACGPLQGAAVGRLIALFAPDDPLEIAGLFAAGAPGDVSAPLIRAWATYLAGERHVIVRRTSRDVVAHVASQLLGVASRLWRSMPPPVVATESVISVGGRVKLSTGEVVFGGGRLEVRPTRAAVRALAGSAVAGAAELRRWLLAMSILRVEREILRRR